MPLDGHSFLVSQGWAGKGKALREGAISRPLIVAQKKTLSGIGKDRDEAFPFWDHVFSAAANAIQVKIQDDDDEVTTTPQPSGSNTPLDRTSTGILSNRPTKIGAPAISAPAILESVVGLSLMALAEREAARRSLYARFFRGPVLGGSDEDSIMLEEVISETEVAQTKRKKPKSAKEEKRRGKPKSEKDADTEEKRLRREMKRAMKKERKQANARSTGKSKKEKSLDHEGVQPTVLNEVSTFPKDIRTYQDPHLPARKIKRKIDAGSGKESEPREVLRKKKKRKRSEEVHMA